MQLKTLLAASICLLFACNVYAQQPAPSASATGDCDVHIQGTSLTLSEQCVRKTPELRRALVELAVYLQTVSPTKLASSDYHGPLDQALLRRTVEQLIRWVDKAPGSDAPLGKQFDFYALGDPKDKRPVQYVGYFTPILNVNATETATFRYPIYGKPKGSARLPSRRAIMDGALRGKGLEIAWTDNLVDYYFMQVQGSGLIHYPDGHMKRLGFDGKNSYPYASIGRYMQQKDYLRTDNLSNDAVRQWLRLNPDKLDEVLNTNQSFVFFRPVKDSLRTASSLPMVPNHTAAVDTSMIPFGSIILAELPLRDNKGKIVQHEWRVLLAIDRTAEAKGAVRLGIYMGEGDAAREQAQRLYPAGRAFILHSGATKSP